VKTGRLAVIAAALCIGAVFIPPYELPAGAHGKPHNARLKLQAPRSTAFGERGTATAKVKTKESRAKINANRRGTIRPVERIRRAIRRSAMRDCREHQGGTSPCEWGGGVALSKANRRYAWANVSGPSYDASGILHRARRSLRWKVLRVVGGGVQPCSYWYEVAPRTVVRDFKLRGYDGGDGSGKGQRC
jgi:hypothetical protein